VIPCRIDVRVAVRRLLDRVSTRRRISLAVPGLGLALVRRMSGDVDEGGHVRVDARLGDHGSAVAMTDEDAGPILLVQDALGRGHILIQAGERVLDDRNVVTVPNEDVVNRPPTGAVDEGAVDEQDILHRRCARGACGCAEQ
jgi:hypothetical protein